jgi:ribonuclease P protein component
MLKKQNRMKTRYQFNITRDKGSHQKGRHFHIFVYKPENYEGPAQFGIVVSTKVTKKATERNRIKRLYREVIRANKVLVQDNLWIVIQPTQSSLEKKYEEISTDFIETIQKVLGAN